MIFSSFQSLCRIFFTCFYHQRHKIIFLFIYFFFFFFAFFFSSSTNSLASTNKSSMIDVRSAFNTKLYHNKNNNNNSASYSNIPIHTLKYNQINRKEKNHLHFRSINTLKYLLIVCTKSKKLIIIAITLEKKMANKHESGILTFDFKINTQSIGVGRIT